MLDCGFPYLRLFCPPHTTVLQVNVVRRVTCNLFGYACGHGLYYLRRLGHYGLRCRSVIAFISCCWPLPRIAGSVFLPHTDTAVQRAFARLPSVLHCYATRKFANDIWFTFTWFRCFVRQFHWYAVTARYAAGSPTAGALVGAALPRALLYAVLVAYSASNRFFFGRLPPHYRCWLRSLHICLVVRSLLDAAFTVGLVTTNVGLRTTFRWLFNIGHCR